MPSSQEVRFHPDEFIVSKTDLKGRITYTNRTFLEVSGFVEADLLGKPHSVIRHEDMPRAVFKALWDHIQDGREIFAYVKNRCHDPERYYWVLAHVTPSRNGRGEIVGYHSVRRVPDRGILEGTIIPLYRELRAIEETAGDRREGLVRSYERLTEHLQPHGGRYDAWVFSL